MTNCSLILVALFLIGLGLGDSPLVILSLCSLVLLFVFSSCLLHLFYCFLFCFLFVCVPLCTLSLASCFLEVLLIYLSYWSKKSLIIDVVVGASNLAFLVFRGVRHWLQFSSSMLPFLVFFKKKKNSWCIFFFTLHIWSNTGIYY